MSDYLTDYKPGNNNVKVECIKNTSSFFKNRS